MGRGGRRKGIREGQEIERGRELERGDVKIMPLDIICCSCIRLESSGGLSLPWAPHVIWPALIAIELFLFHLYSVLLFCYSEQGCQMIRRQWRIQRMVHWLK